LGAAIGTGRIFGRSLGDKDEPRTYRIANPEDVLNGIHQQKQSENARSEKKDKEPQAPPANPVLAAI
jgi:hypothetical protein